MTTYDDPRAELEQLTARYRHLREEHRRAPAGGSVRRRLERDMREAQDHAERRIDALVGDAAHRDGWREHMLHGGPAPDRPASAAPPAQPGAPERPEGRRPWPR